MLVEIGRIVIALTSDVSFESMWVSEYRDFLCPTCQPDITINLHYTGVPRLQLLEQDRVFDSDTSWSLHRQSDHLAFALRSGTTDAPPYCIGVVDAHFRHGDVYNEPITTARVTSPIPYPLSEVFMVCLLAQGRGLMVHACGISDRGHGYLFAGNSTHGKTTMARLWKDQAVILNDDRIILRPHEGRFWMYGTPWHGEYDGVSPQGVALEKVFFLHHADENRAVAQHGMTAASMLLTRCFPPLWDAAGMEFTLDFCAQVIEHVPCYELGFVPDGDVLDFVRCVT